LQEALRVALVEEPSLRQIWPDVAALLASCARMRDWEHEVALADLVGFVGRDLKEWQGRLAEGVEQQEEGTMVDQQIDENIGRLGYE
jgi:predicted transcriptional regulator